MVLRAAGARMYMATGALGESADRRVAYDPVTEARRAETGDRAPRAAAIPAAIRASTRSPSRFARETGRIATGSVVPVVGRSAQHSDRESLPSAGSKAVSIGLGVALCGAR